MHKKARMPAVGSSRTAVGSELHRMPVSWLLCVHSLGLRLCYVHAGAGIAFWNRLQFGRSSFWCDPPRICLRSHDAPPGAHGLPARDAGPGWPAGGSSVATARAAGHADAAAADDAAAAATAASTADATAAAAPGRAASTNFSSFPIPTSEAFHDRSSWSSCPATYPSCWSSCPASCNLQHACSWCGTMRGDRLRDRSLCSRMVSLPETEAG